MLTKEDLEFYIMLKEQDKADNILKINMGRRQGHTTAMLDVASDKDIIVAMYIGRPLKTNPKVVTRHNLDSLRGINLSGVRYIFIDDASAQENNLRSIMMSLAMYRPKMFILLQ